MCEQVTEKKHENIIKTRDDFEPIFFSINPENNKEFIIDSINCAWCNDEKRVKISDLRQRIEPWLTSLFQSEHLSLLAGSGLTHAVHYIAAGKAAAGMNFTDFSHFNDEIKNAAKNSSKKAGRKEGNFEDQIRIANELLKGLEILKDSKADELRQDICTKLEGLAKSVLSSETGIALAEEEKRISAINCFVDFLLSFSSRTAARDRLHIFTTNYDRLIELGAEIAGLHLLDRFVGNLAPIFRSSRLDLDVHYNPPGIRGEPRYLEGVTRFTKLHGSIDWVESGHQIRKIGVPFGVNNLDCYLKAPIFNVDHNKLMIFPNSSKDRETSEYPYVELFRDFAAAICRPNSTIVTYGYSFGDEHINRVIEDMLTIPSTHLVIISYDDPLGRIMKTYHKFGRSAQITLLIGTHLGDFETLVKNYLPKSAIDRTTYKMAELLKSRIGTASVPTQNDANSLIEEPK